ncbi:DUF6193 family natural product biosynthesis protein [Streptomyces sp. AK08-02]|uniref:DUF6193 family natural product biosynthesis protein n=1 Tax=Streptomyces sp. AK08-02 TaxID=3028654 RepID=UPI0029AC422D|nr:DUF6193 family natural product biosynthesis protein [Streptomyces sp. AK08-02]MDX3749577.1 DUF6193 family natural product biosynthesis protein [Streptomyces sp. AK08-02]
MTDLVEAAWRQILMTAEDPTRLVGSQFVEPYAEMVRAAYAEPQLRQLFPWTGMWELHFSRCTQVRHTWDIPYVAPAKDGRFLVSGPSRAESVGHADTVEAAIAMVVERLPPDCGPAFVGTSEELAAYERARDTR